eukprot:scaffold27764_cov40-Prasinocladus_malaysianus.AAC.1
MANCTYQIYLGEEQMTTKDAALAEQNQLLEHQVETLSRQVSSLQDACKAQEREIARLYSQPSASRAQVGSSAYLTT